MGRMAEGLRIPAFAGTRLWGGVLAVGISLSGDMDAVRQPDSSSIPTKNGLT